MPDQQTPLDTNAILLHGCRPLAIEPPSTADTRGSPSALLESQISSGYAKNCADTWSTYKGAGKIPSDRENSQQHWECLREMADFLDNGKPDQITYDFMKRLFFAISSEAVESRESILPQQYLRIAKQLRAGEVVVLEYCHSREPRQGRGSLCDAATWLSNTASKTQLGSLELVEINEASLIDKRLLTPRHHPDKSAVSFAEHGRLTELGHQLCRFLQPMS